MTTPTNPAPTEPPSGAAGPRLVLWSLSDIAGHLNLTRQRAWQLSRLESFPAPTAQTGAGQMLWDPAVIEGWTRIDHRKLTKPTEKASRIAQKSSPGPTTAHESLRAVAAQAAERVKIAQANRAEPNWQRWYQLLAEAIATL